MSRREAVDAAMFYASDVREEMEATNVKHLNKNEIYASYMAWLNSVRVLESYLKEATKSE